tara:strand:+ start:1079 stop:1477 length:399 start_codon:yes stop_codon:yes gene_type:complete
MNIKSSKELVEKALKEIKTLEPEEVKDLESKNQCTLVDIRDIRELWRDGTIKGALHIPRGMLEFWMDPQSQYFNESKFSKEKKLVLFCAAGMRSALATKTLKDMGYENIAHVRGGFTSLTDQGFEIISKEKK